MMTIKAIKFRTDGFYAQPFAFGGETEHMAWEAQYLFHIEKLGYENFLIAMM